MHLRADTIAHRTFADLPRVLRSGDVLVVNETRVIAARLFGRREPSAGAVELLLLRPADGARYSPNAVRWKALAKPARRLSRGARILFDGGATATIVEEGDEGMRTIEFDVREPFEAFLERCGRMPLPPYIHNDSDEAQRRYQTVFARTPGSVAAPTASLHFTDELLAEVREAGVIIAPLVLDVGLGTFRPMATERIDDHRMHAERYEIPEATAAVLAQARSQGRRIIAVGTTVVRALEGSAACHDGVVAAGEGETDIFITPGFRFAVVDAMITNFHLPRSTLLVLVSAFAGRERILHAYREAIERQYRFFSFGDAMFIDPEGKA